MHWGRLSGKSRWVNGEDVVGDNVVTDEVVTNEYRWTPECQRGRLLVVKKALRERDVIDALRDAFPDAGIGDDAAVLPRMGRAVLFATDAVVEGIHFRREFSTLSQAIQSHRGRDTLQEKIFHLEPGYSKTHHLQCLGYICNGGHPQFDSVDRWSAERMFSSGCGPDHRRIERGMRRVRNEARGWGYGPERRGILL